MRKAKKEIRKEDTKVIIAHLKVCKDIANSSTYRTTDKERNICMQYGFIMGYYYGAKTVSLNKVGLAFKYVNALLDKVNKEREV